VTTIDLPASLTIESDDGFQIASLDKAPDPTKIVPGAIVIAGNRWEQVEARIITVDHSDGFVQWAEVGGYNDPGDGGRTPALTSAP
jgi:hypothetical protein